MIASKSALLSRPLHAIKEGVKIAVMGFALLALPLSMASAELDDALTQAGWDEITFDDAEPNRFRAIHAEHGRVEGVSLVSQESVSIAYLNVNINLDDLPNLSWQWKSITPPVDTDITKKGGDDRSLAIYVAFPYQPEHASFGEKLGRVAVEALRGKDTPGRVLTYVWGGGAERGAMTPNPYVEDYGRFIFLRTPDDAQGEWLSESVNIRSDFIKAFGFEPASPQYIGIGSDSDDTKKRIEAEVQYLEFTQ